MHHDAMHGCFVLMHSNMPCTSLSLGCTCHVCHICILTCSFACIAHLFVHDLGGYVFTCLPSLSCFLPRSGKHFVDIHFGYADTAAVFCYCIVVISLSMYVMAACISTLQDTLSQGAQGHSGRPHLHPYFCSALQVLFARDASTDRAPIIYQLRQTHPSATQRRYSRSRAPVCLHVLPVPERVPCQPYPCHCPCHRPQDRFYLSSFRYIETSYRLPVSVSA